MTADEFFETIEKNTEYEDIALCAGINCLDCFVKEDFRANGCYRYFIKYLIEEMQKRIDLMLDFLPEEVELIAQMEKTERMVLDKYENR